ncbi:hypothetical protein LJ737_12640 [Hymenobacter sp. 15J16-1T3B]|uniref:hypothetical protein n=1 Tax=Hymenobacter sp. 15J16-1T3B TaxID=2886941 RepID=UPI001D12E90D|nr:hypothetical protein [Hymenobacter sp. 15J16-1T3B]MCC3158089.1 hypothetical protein [Hymenobacter sp. 15J16-1T3B]
MRSLIRAARGAGLGAWLLTLCLLVGLLGSARAQVKVQVVARTVEQTLACPVSTLVRIRAEKATLRVQAWDKPSLRVVLRLVARHPEREVAERDLPVARYQIEKTGTLIELVNYFAVTPGAPAVQSDLRAEYTVLMPADNAIEIVNAYGHTTLTGLAGRQQLEQDFGQVTLQDLRGSLLATVRLADINGTNTNLALSCNADRSAVTLQAAGGSYAIRNRFGSVTLEPTAELRSATIDAEQTEVKLTVAHPDQFDYVLSTSRSTLTVPPALSGQVRKTGNQQTLRTNSGHRLPLIRAVTSLAPVTLQATPLLIKR